MPEPVVELLGLEKTYKDFWGRAKVTALHPLNLDLYAGEILALLGPNGAGKSTTIKLILGLLFPTRGRVRVFGGSPRTPSTRARLGYLPEETRLHKFLDARETLDLFGRLHGLPRPERRRRIDQLIAMVGLAGNDRRPVGEFSKGMARRIGLAVALSGDPDLLILDEPTSGLDPLGTREIKTLMTQLRERGRTILLSSHLLDDVEDVADRIAILYGGRLRQLGRTRELLAQSDRVRVELDRPAGRSPEDVAKEVETAVGTGGVEVSIPSARLESLFTRVVASAEADETGTAGARQGGPIAAFLLGDDAAPVTVEDVAVGEGFIPSRAGEGINPSPTIQDPQPESAPGPRVESLVPEPEVELPEVVSAASEAAPAEPTTPRPTQDDLATPADESVDPPLDVASSPAEPARTLPPPSNPILAKLLGLAPAQDQPAEAPAEVHATDAPVITETSTAARALLARLMPGAAPAEPREIQRVEPVVAAAPRELSDKGKSVLDRIVPKADEP